MDGASPPCEPVSIRLHQSDLQRTGLESMRCQLLTRAQMESLVAANQDLRIYSRDGVRLEACASTASTALSIPDAAGRL